MEPTQHAAVSADLQAIVAAERGNNGAVWSLTCADLNVNLVRWESGGVSEHLNAEVDVLLVGVTGAGVVTVDGVDHRLEPAVLCLVPKGARRAIRSVAAPFAYLTCHRQRGGLWPV